MKTRLVYIILLFALNLIPVVSLASSPAITGEQDSSAHDRLACLDCHSYIKENQGHPLVEESNSSCMECHELSSVFSLGGRDKVECLNCHTRHHEKVANDAHINVTCKACHLSETKPVKKLENNLPVWGYESGLTGGHNLHRLTTGKENICSRCHFKGNKLGVSDYSLPAKSIICMPCHAATFSIGDIPSTTAIVIFLIGISSTVLMWLSAGRGREKKTGFKFIDFIRLCETLILDVLFQRRLLKVSTRRWIIHGMIFFPFFIRFLWGITALILSLLNPEWNITWVMLDKNNPATGFLFDLSGLMILTGGCLMVIEKRLDKKMHDIKGLPKNDIPVHILLGGMIITGFIVEGVRIAMTGSPEGSQFAFIGYGIGRIISGYRLNGIYAYLWYLHAVLTAVFIAYLPFSRMFHIFTTPLSLFLRGVSRE